MTSFSMIVSTSSPRTTILAWATLSSVVPYVGFADITPHWIAIQSGPRRG